MEECDRLIRSGRHDDDSRPMDAGEVAGEICLSNKSPAHICLSHKIYYTKREIAGSENWKKAHKYHRPVSMKLSEDAAF